MGAGCSRVRCHALGVHNDVMVLHAVSIGSYDNRQISHLEGRKFPNPGQGFLVQSWGETGAEDIRKGEESVGRLKLSGNEHQSRLLGSRFEPILQKHIFPRVDPRKWILETESPAIPRVMY